MERRTIFSLKICLTLLIIVTPILSCERKSEEKRQVTKEMTPKERAHYEMTRTALKETSKPIDVSALLMGHYSDFSVRGRVFRSFIGKVWIRARAKNNTKYCFKWPILLTIEAKNYKTVESQSGNKRLVTSCLLMSGFGSVWKPGEIITLTGESSGNSEEGEDTCFVKEYLTDTLKLPANELVKIDEYVSKFDIRASPIDCF